MNTYKKYKPIFINRLTGEQEEANYFMHLFPHEVISKQVELSTVKTILMLREEVTK